MHNLVGKSGKNLLGLSFVLGSLGISKLIKFNLILGSVKCFSAVNVMGPLAVVFGGLPGSILFLLLNFVFGLKSLAFITSSGIPTLFAGWYWRSDSRLFRIFVPLLCMALFWENSVGMAAWPYALFWLIPSVIGALNPRNVFLKSLGATFMAHGVGSIIWLYVIPMLPSQWLSLMPIVPVERCLFAAAMACSYTLIVSLSNKLVGWSTIKGLWSKREA